MMLNSNTDLVYGSRTRSEPAFPEVNACACGGLNVKTLLSARLEGKYEQSGHPEGVTNVDDAGSIEKEDEVLALAIELLESMGLTENLPAIMRLIEHLGETAGYQCAQQPVPIKVTELMLMAARASKLADEFRQNA